MAKAVKSFVGGVGKAVSGVVKAVGSIVTGVVNAVSSVVSGVINFVVSPFLGLFGLGTPSMPNEATPDSLKGVMVQRNGSDQYVPVVYGYRKVAGTIVFAETGSDSNKYLWVAYVMSEGPVEGLYEVWLDNTQLPSSLIPALNRGERVTVTGDSKFSNLTQLQFSAGVYKNNPAETNVGNAIKNGIFAGSPSFTNTMHYNGLATVFARYEWPSDTTNNPFGGSIPKLEVCMLGRKVARLTTGTPEAYEWGQFGDGYTESYSANPAEIILDYLRNPFYGKGLTNDDIHWDSFKIAAAKYNQEVTFLTGVTGPVLRLDYVVKTEQTIFNNCKEMLSNCRSYLPYTNGKYKIIVEDAGNPTDITSGVAPIAATFNKDNIVGEITYTGIDRASKYNSVTVNYTDPGNQWSPQSVTFPETFAARQALITADGGREYTGDFTFAGITNPGIAKDFARLILNKSRYQDSISLTVTSQAFELEPGDNIYIDANILKFGTDPELFAVPWRIISIKLNNNYTFSLGCVRNPDFIYPHVRGLEIDYKYALYVPKGATRYYPKEPIGIPVGYNPPTYAPISDTDANVPPPISGTGRLIDAVSLYDYKVNVRSGLIYVSETFNQPDNSAYSSVIVRYKQNISSVTTWTQIEVTQKPGANQPISFEIGPLVNNAQYYLTTQVKYTTGDLSTVVTPNTINVQANLGTTTTPGSGSGSTTPTVTTTVTPTAGNYFSYVSGLTVTSGGLPLSTRQVAFTLKQDMGLGVNPYLDGVEVFYKPSINPKWYRSTVAATVTQGNEIGFSLSLGSRLYPSVPGSGGVSAVVDDYDFIFRFTYSDGRTSQYQYHASNCSVEHNGSGYSFNIFTTGSIVTKELTSAYTPQLMSLTDIPDTRTLELGLRSIKNSISAGVQRIYFNFNSPSTADFVNWKGIRLYSHKVGTTLTWTQDDFALTYDSVVGAYFISLDILYNTAYEYVIVPLVEYGGTVEASNGRYVSGSINASSGDVNWMSFMNVQSNEAVATAKARIGSAPASDPTRTTLFDSIDATTVVSGGYPMTPRKLSFTMKQTVVVGSPSARLAGIKIYYKRSVDAYYYVSKYPLPSGYTEGDTLTFDSTQTSPAMTLGNPNYPNPLPSTDNYQTYDFIFRWYYDDDTDSNKELNFTAVKGRSCAIERCQGVYNFHILGATGTSFGAAYPTTGSITYDKSNLTTTTVTNQAPNTVTVVTDVTSTLTPYQFEATTLNGVNRMIFYTSKPSAEMNTYYRGCRVLYREITLGVNNAYTTMSDTSIIQNNAIVVNGVVKTDGIGTKIENIKWDTEYEFAIIPQVIVGTTVTDATNCFYVRGKFHTRVTETTGANPYPSYDNWLAKYRAQVVATSTALSTISNYPSQLTSPPYLAKVTSQCKNPSIVNKKYWKLQFTIPAGTTFNMYRRSTCAGSTTYPQGYDTLSLWGLGQWEKVEAVADTHYTIDANNLVTMYVRPAISGLYEFYKSVYWASSISSTNPLYDNPRSATENTYKKLVGDLGIPTALIPGAESTQFCIVIKYNNGVSVVESSKAVLFNPTDSGVANTVVTLTTINFSQAVYSSTVTGTVISPVPSGIDNTSSYTNNLKRTISEARTIVSASNIKLGADNATTYTVPTVTGGTVI